MLHGCMVQTKRRGSFYSITIVTGGVNYFSIYIYIYIQYDDNVKYFEFLIHEKNQQYRVLSFGRCRMPVMHALCTRCYRKCIGFI